MQQRKQIVFESSLAAPGASREKLHFIPCTHNYCGPAKVKEYFDSLITRRDDGSLEAYLYGALLLGEQGKHSSPEVLTPEHRGTRPSPSLPRAPVRAQRSAGLRVQSRVD